MIKYLKRIQNNHIVGTTMVVAGYFLCVLQPTGTSSVLENVYHIPSVIFGVITLLCGSTLIFVKTRTAFIICTIPFLLYISAAIFYVVTNPGLNPAGLSFFLGYYAIILRLLLTQESDARPQ